MEIFDQDIAWLRSYLESRRALGRDVRRLDSAGGGDQYRDFLDKGRPTVVLSEDTWLELGHPSTTSTALVLVTERLEVVDDGAVTLVGPDLPAARGSLPFGQILLLASRQLQEEDYRRINSFQYELELQGYMIKAIPSSLTIWSRVSRESAEAGFSFQVLGRAIRERYQAEFDIPSLEIIFVTGSEGDVEELQGLRRKVTRIIAAMNKMTEELAFDCSSCEYLDVCGDVRQLGALREKLLRERRLGSGR